MDSVCVSVYVCVLCVCVMDGQIVQAVFLLPTKWKC